MNAIDVVTSLGVVACAAAFLARRALGPTAAPACHVAGGACTRTAHAAQALHTGDVASSEPAVVVGASLSRALERASRRHEASAQK